MTRQRFNDTVVNLPRNTRRTRRGYEINGQWYFELRGGGQRGPFDSEIEMLIELQHFIQYQQEMNQRI